jgi:hypothetical protein
MYKYWFVSFSLCYNGESVVMQQHIIVHKPSADAEATFVYVTGYACVGRVVNVLRGWCYL